MNARAKLLPVPIDPRAGAAYGLESALPAGAIVVLPGGVVCRIRPDGAVDELGGPPLRKSIASDPAARGAHR